MRIVVSLLMLVTLSVSTSAHHSANLHFDRNDFVEIEGVLTEVKWQNPHIQLTVATVDEEGREAVWLIDTVSILSQTRRGVTKNLYRVGSNIRVAGFRGRRNRTAIYATNTLLADGRELLEGSSPGPLWSTNLVMSAAAYQAAKVEKSTDDSSGIFRVWSRDLEARTSGEAGRSLWKDSYPLTEHAKATQASWDRIADNPFIYCLNGMPAIMDSISPMEIALEGSEIFIRVEEQDVVRRIHLGAVPTRGTPTPYGFSSGRWEGETLVVTTTDIDWAWFDQAGIPQSEELRLVERFRTIEDGRYLDYSVTATDPAVFTEPVVLERRWFWVPGEEIKPYECIWERDDL